MKEGLAGVTYVIMGAGQSRRIATENQTIAAKTGFSLEQVQAWRQIFLVYASCLSYMPIPLSVLDRTDYRVDSRSSSLNIGLSAELPQVSLLILLVSVL